MIYLRSLLLLLIMCSLVSINTQGLRSPDRRKTAFHFFKIHKYDIIFLQETHCTTDLPDVIQREWTGDIYFNHGTANSCSVAILFNPRFNYTHINTSQDSSGRVLAITIKIDDHYLQLVNLYAPNSDTDRRQFFPSLELFFSSRYHHVIGGDFNSIANPTLDKQGGNVSSTQYALRVLHNLTSQFDLVDIWRQRNPNKRGFTRTGRDPRQIIPLSAHVSTVFIYHNLSPLTSPTLQLSPIHARTMI